ncbi:MAG TPA: SusF/SusE family outer membrane protein [Ohtaekwangia sp.]|nr:SusF/SusE family outer membrane protein [Ohtaekwangia sp.]
MKILQYSFLFLAAMLMCACEDEQNENKGKGESINDFKLISPGNFSSLVLNPSTPDKTIVLQWEPAKTGLGGTPTYQVLIDKKGGDFTSPLFQTPADGEGIDNTKTITYANLKEAIAGAGTTEFIWTVVSTTETNQGLNSKSATDPFALNIIESTVGIADFEYTSPGRNQKLFLDKITTPDEEVVFSWTPTTSTSGDVIYTWVAATTEDGFSDPVLEILSDNDGAQPSLTLTQAEFVDLLSEVSFTDGLYWQVRASVEDVSYTPETRFVWFEIFDVQSLYIVGSLTNGWSNTCDDVITIANKGNGLFESLVYLPAGSEFKFILTCGSWDVNWGSPTEDLISPNTDYGLIGNGGNIKVEEEGSYFVKADFATGQFSINPFTPPADIFLVGGSTSADWNPGNSIQFIEKGNNVFEIYAYLEVAGSGFKFLQVQDWAGDWGSKGGSRTINNGTITGDLVQEGEDNAAVEEDGFYRITVDYTNLKYKIEPMVWGIIGSSRTGDDTGWNAQDNMTFEGGKGSYKWTITQTLFAGELKFRANDDWGINFGDSGGDQTLEYDGSNLNVTAGTYLIELVLDPVNGYTYSLTTQ